MIDDADCNNKTLFRLQRWRHDQLKTQATEFVTRTKYLLIETKVSIQSFKKYDKFPPLQN